MTNLSMKMKTSTITIERFCACGERLNATAKDDDEARAKLTEFLSQHIGREDDGTVHQPMKRKPYWRMVNRLRAELRAEAERMLKAQAAMPNVRRYRLK